ncbi:Hypothetical protein NTJ_05018 [Nesidiocoris tenuis]|uniref:PRANC domain-containing protein n=1 Tax=Nesidiocoris tenuis TaxID=355587 RepID=A0ABN7AIW8_9HEMI|nr:Hypothetical protein NTJ_05018 [Nesidiocoris tenuis]
MAGETGSSSDAAIGQLVSLMESISLESLVLRHARQLKSGHLENEHSKDEKDGILAVLQSDENVLEALDNSGRGVLHYMMSLHFPGRMDVLKAMRSMSSFNVNIRDSESKTPLHYALNEDNIKLFAKMSSKEQHTCGSLLEIFKFLLDSGADVDALDNSDVHPLHLALDQISSTRQHELLQEIPEIVITLLSSSVSLKPFLLGREGSHRVFFVIMAQGPYSFAIMKSLVNRDSVKDCNSRGVPLVVSVIHYSKDCDLVVEKVSFLLSLGADVNLCNVEGQSPLARAFEVREPFIEPLVLLLLENGARIDNAFSEDTTFFHEVCKTGQFDVFENLSLFLESGADIYATDLRGSLALHKVICRITKEEEFFSLVSSGIDVTRSDKAENIALHHLHAVTSVEVLQMLVNLLITYGCSVNHENERGETPLLCFLQSHRNQSLDYIRTLIDLGASVNCQNHEGIAPLHIASRILRKDGKEIPVDMLLEAGADVHLLDDQMNSALHYALRDGQTVDPSSVAKLLAAGCDPNVPNYMGVTPLHVACFSLSEGGVEILLDYGAYINAQDRSGDTPLHFLACSQHLDSSRNGFRVSSIMRLLITRGADPTIKNESGLSPFAQYMLRWGVVYPGDTYNYLVLYIALQSTAGKYVIDDLESGWLDGRTRFHDYFEPLLTSAQDMKTHYLGNSSITFLDFMTMSDLEAARIFRNPSIKKVLEGKFIKEEYFYGFGDFIERKISQCRSMEEILSSAERALSYFCFERPLPTVATDNIIRLLNVKDLEALSLSIAESYSAD